MEISCRSVVGIERENLVARRRGRGVFPLHHGVDGARGENRIAAQDLNVGNSSIREHQCLQTNYTPYSFAFEACGIIRHMGVANNPVTGLGSQRRNQTQRQAEQQQR
jgi:hypothetical protein